MQPTELNSSNPPERLRTIKSHYRSGRASLARDFFTPCLQNCSLYRRAAGYFSSSALVTWVAALPRLAQSSDALIKIIASHRLSPEDIQVLDRVTDPDARREQEQIILERIIDEIVRFADEPSDRALRAKIFAWLLANKKLEIRFAFAAHIEDSGIFHEKIGVFNFPSGHAVAFTGSANETLSGHERNYESIDVYRSWVPGELERVETKIDQFEEAWEDKAEGLNVRELSAKLVSRLEAIAPDAFPSASPSDQDLEDEPPSEVDPARWRHQEEAVSKFLEARAGILEMATGTGKTRTALKILSRLTNEGRVDAAIVTTDGTDLLSQWALELDEWIRTSHSDFIICRHFGEFHELGSFALDPGHAILVISRSQLEKVFERLSPDKRASMIVIHDEVHGLGVPSLVSSLAGQHQSFAYRLGLSATPERAYDYEGNQFIEREIGKTIYSFPLEKAIARGVLCEFDYIPLEYDLTDDDRFRLRQVYARQAARARSASPMSNEELWIELSKVYKTAEMKPSVFAQFLQRDQSILDNCILFVETREYGSRLLDTIHRYTHLYRTYYADDEQEHLLQFARGQISCLITCHRISQGIDIRALKSVVLFSAARSKLETIQRIGRCLRADPSTPNKRARVVDFVRLEKEDDPFPNADQERYEWLRTLSQCRKESQNAA